MSANLNYARAKQQARAGAHVQRSPWSISLRGWRTEWDGEPFPVEVATLSDPFAELDAWLGRHGATVQPQLVNA